MICFKKLENFFDTPFGAFEGFLYSRIMRKKIAKINILAIFRSGGHGNIFAMKSCSTITKPKANCILLYCINFEKYKFQSLRKYIT